MPSPNQFLEHACRESVQRLFGEAAADVAVGIQPCKDPTHGDFQANVAFRLAKALKRAPGDIAQDICADVAAAPMFDAPSIAGGFVNFRFADAWLVERVGELASGSVSPVEPAAAPHSVVIDFSAPNVAKEMHVGHLRSTIIGDTLSRMYEAKGHDVARISHVGDWGTQFGMLITYLREVLPAGESAEGWSMGDLDGFYKAAKARFDEDEGFADRSRLAVVDLQSGEETAREAWLVLCEKSREEFEDIYRRLDVRLVEQGESFYQPYLADVVSDLDAGGLLTQSDGASCVFLDTVRDKHGKDVAIATREGEPLPLIVRKKDGGYTYATTDLAALRYRVGGGAHEVLYVVDQGQSLHLSMVFETARRAGWLPDDVATEHVAFGLVLGEDRKRLRTRSGASIRLRALLDEAVSRATAFATERQQTGAATASIDVEAVGRSLGISSVKYAELSHARNTDYIFSFDKMISLQGNTAPYLLYAHARIRSIVASASALAGGDVAPAALSEHDRAVVGMLVRLDDVLTQALVEHEPSNLCTYMFELSQAFNRFYEAHRIIDEGTVDVLRLRVCEATAAVLAAGFELLGIELVDAL